MKIQHKVVKELQEINFILRDILEMSYDQIQLLSLNFNKWIILLAVLLSMNIMGFIALFVILGQ